MVNCIREWRGDTHWAVVAAAGLAESGEVNPTGLKLRQHIENETDRLTALPWKLLGEDASLKFANDFEGPCEKLLKRVDITAGPNYQPACRLR